VSAALSLVRDESGTKTPDEWAAVIKADLGRTVEGFIAAGKHLSEAKASVGHGEWLPMLATIGIQDRAAQKLMAIGFNPAFANTGNCTYLPKSERALYELSRAPADLIEARIQDGSITPSMTIKDAKDIVRGGNSPEPEASPKPAPRQRNADRLVKHFQRPLKENLEGHGRPAVVNALRQAINNIDPTLMGELAPAQPYPVDHEDTPASDVIADVEQYEKTLLAAFKQTFSPHRLKQISATYRSEFLAQMQDAIKEIEKLDRKTK
jgi:hypothetical protein